MREKRGERGSGARQGRAGQGRAGQGTCLDVLALRQDIETLVHHFARSISAVLGQ